MTNVVELSEEAFQKLKRVAEKRGLTPAEWVEATISRESTEEPQFKAKSVAEAFAPFVIPASETRVADPKYRSAFGDIVDEKLAKQGFKRPEWPR